MSAGQDAGPSAGQAGHISVHASFLLPAVLSVAGSDCSGGAGVQADLKTIGAWGLYGMCALTALTAQNTCGVAGVAAVAPEFVEAQIDTVFDDIPPAAVKVGMVGEAAACSAVARALARRGAANVVVDPVMVATSGSALEDSAAVRALVEELLPLADVVTPNLAEAQALSGVSIQDAADRSAACERAAEKIASLTPGAVLVKGGHATGDASDLLRLADGTRVWIEGARVDNPNAHGTGCTLSSAIACGLACGAGVEDAVRAAKAYVTGALAAGLDLGRGSGPLDHFWKVRQEGSFSAFV